MTLFAIVLMCFALLPIASAQTTSIWSSNPVPTVEDSGDGSAVELGVKFRSDVAGYITGVRFYKAAANTGTHRGSLWSSTGALLAQATFSSETASGWQQVTFATPVAVAANTTYIASYYAPVGRYSFNDAYFASTGFDSGTLHAPSSASSGGNGVYRYGGGFPDQTSFGANYWVDVLFSTTALDVVPPTVVSVLPANAATGVSTTGAVVITFSEPMNAATVSSSTIELRNSANALVPATVAYNAASNIATVTPSSALAFSSTYTVRVLGGSTDPRVKDVANNALAATFTSTFTTAATSQPAATLSIWSTNPTPAVIDSNDGNAVELGVKFRSDIAGFVTGIRFYKATTNTGTHRASLWSSTGTLLATATFSGETASGWQQVTFPAPVAMSANTTYVASYFAPAGHYSLNTDYFSTNGSDNGTLHAPSSSSSGGNGVYRYGGGFPNQTYAGTNYWVDVMVAYGTAQDTTLPTVSSASPAAGATGVLVGANTTATFNEAMTVSTINATTFELRVAATNVLVPATVTYSSITNTATLDPSANLALGTSYRATVKGGSSGVKDAAGNALAADITWTFTTQSSTDTIPPTVTTSSPAVSATGVNIAANATARFSEGMSASTINGTTFELRDVATGTIVPATITYDSTTFTATLDPSANLAYSTSYSATVKSGTSGVKDLAGNALAADYIWTFTTQAQPTQDTTPPTIVSFSPGFSATAVDVGANTTVQFSEAMAGSSINSTTFELRNATTNAVISAAITYDTASRTATLNPSANLSNAAVYRATVKGGSAGVKDSAGNPLGADFSWTFTTRQLYDQGPGGPILVITKSTNPFTRYYAEILRAEGLNAFALVDIGSVTSTLLKSYDIAILGEMSLSSTQANMFSNWVSGGGKLIAMRPDSDLASLLGVRAVGANMSNAYVSINTTAAPGAGIVGDTMQYHGTADRYTLNGASAIAWLNTTAVQSLWDNSSTPIVADSADARAIEVGVKFRSDVAGYITGIRFYKSAANTGTHTGSLWSSTGTRLATATFSGESASGWQQVMFSTPVAISANTTYIASYFAPRGHAAADTGYFLNPRDNGVLHAPVSTSTSPNGVFRLTSTSAFPNQTLTNTNYWVDVVFTTTNNPAVTLRSVGTSGGQVAAFTYDLARSIVYTRQGNPAWVGQERDGITPVRSDDLFYGAAASGSQPDWIDMNKVAIPQADEQQRLLANLILHMNRSRKPLPRFWYLPEGLKAAILMTGDDHGNGGTAGRWDRYLALSPPGCSVAAWDCIRGTSYVYPNTPLTDAQVASYQQQGFELALHVTTSCNDFTPSTLPSFYSTQLAQFRAAYPSANAVASHRMHCLVWSDWATQAKVELSNGIRLDVNYYYWPATWVLDRPGFMTGSGMPMRFADVDGTMIDVYQAATQMTDESGQSYPGTVDALLNRALGPEGYYGVFTANMHTDFAAHDLGDAILASAIARGVPVVSARQMLDWVDGRNASAFTSMSWSSNTLTFSITRAPGSTGLVAMLPTAGPTANLSTLTLNGTAVPFSTTIIKGVRYATFAAASGTYRATYTAP